MKKNNEKKLKFGIPGGSIKEPIENLLQRAGYEFNIDERFNIASIDDEEIECFFGRANEIALLVARGLLDGGIVTRAALAETQASVKEILQVGTVSSQWKNTKIVLAVPENSPIKTIADLKGKKILTRLPFLAQKFLEKHKIKAEVEFSEQRNEARVPALADALVEFINTGKTIAFYNLKVLATLMEDANMVVVVANPALKEGWKKEKLETISMLLKGARLGEEMVGLMLHASNSMMEEVFKILPALKKPTVTLLRGQNWFDVFSVVKKNEVRRLVPKLKRIGCTDIVEFSLSKVIL